MHTLEDYDDSLRNPDIVLHPLPPYNYANFFQEYPQICVVITAFCAIAFSMYFWRFFQPRRKDDNAVLGGRFSSSVLRKVQHKIMDKNTDVAMKSLCVEESFEHEPHNNFHDDESDEVVVSFNELYGKLASAKLRVKTNRLEKTMTEEERREEQLIQQKQLESICEIIMQEPQKFGLHDKSEIAEQMKLYSL